MSGARHKDHGPQRTALRLRMYERLLWQISRQYRRTRSMQSSRALLSVATKCEELRQELKRYKRRLQQLKDTEFIERLRDMTNLDCLRHFSFDRKGLQRLLNVFDWRRTRTRRNRYKAEGITVLCVVLARLSNPHVIQRKSGDFPAMTVWQTRVTSDESRQCCRSTASQTRVGMQRKRGIFQQGHSASHV